MTPLRHAQVHRARWDAARLLRSWGTCSEPFPESRRRTKGITDLSASSSVWGRSGSRKTPECHHITHTGKPGHWSQPAWVYEMQALFDQPGLLL